MLSEVMVKYSISSRICLRNPLSLISPDHLCLHARTDVWRQRVWRDQIHLSQEEVLQEERKVHEIIKCRLLELHQNVYIAVLFLLATGKGSEDANPSDSETSSLSLLHGSSESQ